jgi:hypothetical protein
MKIYVSVKNVYGQTLVYPACPKAAIFAAVARTKTLSHDVLTRIENLGYEIVTVAPDWR